MMDLGPESICSTEAILVGEQDHISRTVNVFKFLRSIKVVCMRSDLRRTYAYI
jgi:hypothetical protein